MRGEVKFWRNLERKDLKHYTAVLLNLILKIRDTLQIEEKLLNSRRLKKHNPSSLNQYLKNIPAQFWICQSFSSSDGHKAVECWCVSSACSFILLCLAFGRKSEGPLLLLTHVAPAKPDSQHSPDSVHTSCWYTATNYFFRLLKNTHICTCHPTCTSQFFFPKHLEARVFHI